MNKNFIVDWKYSINLKSAGYTKLEIILIGFLLITFLFLFSKNSSLFQSNNKQSLEKRFNQYSTLIINKQLEKAYEYLSKSAKEKTSKDTFVNDRSTTYEIHINNIVLNGNTGYVDRTLIGCPKGECSNKETARSYRKWIFENGEWYFTYDPVYCIRSTPYEIAPEFDRALSLIKQRITDFVKKWGNDVPNFLYFNCLDIKYANLEDEEGYFSFDLNDSSLDKLQIIVDTSYKEKDDILTSLLLVHEITHAENYLNDIINGTKTDCVDNEIHAFSNQLLFLNSLNPEEQNSVNQRLKSGYYYISSPLKITWELLTMSNNANAYCGGNNQDCYDNRLNNNLKNKIITDPYYKKQCGL